MAPLCYRRHRFPPEIIQHAIWLYLRFDFNPQMYPRAYHGFYRATNARVTRQAEHDTREALRLHG
jgi:transposase-like protein